MANFENPKNAPTDQHLPIAPYNGDLTPGQILFKATLSSLQERQKVQDIKKAQADDLVITQSAGVVGVTAAGLNDFRSIDAEQRSAQVQLRVNASESLSKYSSQVREDKDFNFVKDQMKRIRESYDLYDQNGSKAITTRGLLNFSDQMLNDNWDGKANAVRAIHDGIHDVETSRSIASKRIPSGLEALARENGLPFSKEVSTDLKALVDKQNIHEAEMTRGIGLPAIKSVGAILAGTAVNSFVDGHFFKNEAPTATSEIADAGLALASAFVKSPVKAATVIAVGHVVFKGLEHCVEDYYSRT